MKTTVVPQPIDKPAAPAPASEPPLVELRRWLRQSCDRFLALRLWPAKARTEIAAQICADAIAESAALSAEAHAAEVDDLEAARLIEDAARDGLQASDMAALARALRHIRRSAHRDHTLSERTTIPA